MSIARRSRAPRPDSPGDELGRLAAFPNPRHQKREDEPETDTRGLKFRKIHPDRNAAYRKWLRFRPCSVAGLTDSLTDRLHDCWSVDMVGRMYLSDPCHTGKTGMGIKGDDSGCFSLCRHAHRAQEANMDEFDRRFGINRHEVAARQFARFNDEQGKRGLK